MAWFRRKKNSVGKSEDEKKKKKEPAVRKSSLAYKAAERQTKKAVQQPPEQAKPISETPRHEPISAAPAAYQKPQLPHDLPGNYGDNQIYLMVRDPFWLFTYWEIQSDHQQNMLNRLGGNWNDVKSVLRTYDVTDKKTSAPFFDIVLQNMAQSWYINVAPNRSYFVEIGLLHADGRFIALARSNEVTTPRMGMSEVIDDQWMGLDFDKMYALSGGFQVGKSSAELQKMMQEFLMGGVSSASGAGMISSLASPVKKGKKRGFWFVLDCELIVYGATEPDARVTMQGKEVKLRPDGTFTLRYALPDGKYVLDAHAYSADGIEERIIIPIVQRRTERPAPILKATNEVKS